MKIRHLLLLLMTRMSIPHVLNRIKIFQGRKYDPSSTINASFYLGKMIMLRNLLPSNSQIDLNQIHIFWSVLAEYVLLTCIVHPTSFEPKLLMLKLVVTKVKRKS